jgi:hypothetical protein
MRAGARSLKCAKRVTLSFLRRRASPGFGREAKHVC